MKQEATLIRARLKTLRRRRRRRYSLFGSPDYGPFTVPAFGPGRFAGDGAWLKTSSNKVALALNLVPFAGIAFSWFIGVLRDRSGGAALLPRDSFFRAMAAQKWSC